jgi:hypothetical protein
LLCPPWPHRRLTPTAAGMNSTSVFILMAIAIPSVWARYSLHALVLRSMSRKDNSATRTLIGADPCHAGRPGRGDHARDHDHDHGPAHGADRYYTLAVRHSRRTAKRLSAPTLRSSRFSFRGSSSLFSLWKRNRSKDAGFRDAWESSRTSGSTRGQARGPRSPCHIGRRPARSVEDQPQHQDDGIGTPISQRRTAQKNEGGNHDRGKSRGHDLRFRMVLATGLRQHFLSWKTRYRSRRGGEHKVNYTIGQEKRSACCGKIDRPRRSATGPA